jgi:tetratricopeptide (TPR) repeat protein
VLLGIVRRSLRSVQIGGLQASVDPIALAVALLWLVHPLQTEAVTYIIQRCESLMGLFYLLTLYAVVRGATSRRPWPWYGAALLSCLCGMGCKQVMITAPVVVLLYDRVFLGGSFRHALRQRWKLYAGMVAMAGAAILPYLVLTQATQKWAAAVATSTAGEAGPTPTPWAYLATQPGVLVHYLRLSVWPDALCLDYFWPPATTISAILPPALAIAALVGLTAWALARRPAAGFVGAAFFLVLAPTSSLVPMEDMAFEHRMYLPLAAVVAAAVIGGYLVGRRLLRWLVASDRTRTLAGWGLAAVLVLAVAAALGYATARRNNDYRSEAAIWEDTVQKRPDNPRAHGNLGVALLKAGEADRAIEQFNLTLKLGWATPEVFFHRGTAHQKKGDLDKAVRDYTRAIRMKPGYAQAYANRGAVWQTRGRNDLALADLGKAVELAPDLADAWYNRGNARFASGDMEQAVRDYSRAVELAPGMAEAWNNRGAARLEAGRYAQALSDCTRAVELAPDFGPAYRNRAVGYLATKAFDKAWNDVKMCERLGYAVDPALLKELSAASPPPSRSP